MPNWRDYVGGQVAKAKDYFGHPAKAKIEGIELKELKDREGHENQRLCMKLAGIDKLIPLNSAACEAIAEKHGDDYNLWIGKKVSVDARDTKKAGSFQYEWDIKAQ